MRLSAMGDVAMTVPVLRAFVNSIQGKLPWCRAFFKPFLIPFPRFLLLLMKKNTKVFGLLRLFQDLKQLHIDAFADLHIIAV
jgi:ADP-heptose:LPS heptosyltransferase